MWLADLVTPVASTNGHNGELSQNNGTTDGSGYFFGALDSQTNVAVGITNSYGRGLLRLM